MDYGVPGSPMKGPERPTHTMKPPLLSPHAVLLVVLAAGVGVAVGWALGRSAPSSGSSSPEALRAQGSHAPLVSGTGPPPAEPPSFVPGPLSFVVVGGGGSPLGTQVSLEQDVALATSVLGGAGAVFFAGGPGTLSVHFLEPRPVTLRERVGDLLRPEPSRAASFRAPEPPGTFYPARRDLVLATLEHAVRDPGPTLLYVTGHGEQGAEASDNRWVVWEDDWITPAELGEALAPRVAPVRLVMTTCFSGGFAELALDGVGGGPPVCGLFAAPWDLEASGCDPDPNRGVQEGYGLHFWTALTGRDRQGAADPTIDIDGDGAVNLLEAHTHVRVAAASFDVPTTTSERWLREHAPEDGAGSEVSLPEEAFVIAALEEELSVTSPAEAEAQLAVLSERLEEDDRALQEQLAAVEGEGARLRARLLERYPSLADPYRSDFEATLEAHGGDIEGLLDRGEGGLAELEAIYEEGFARSSETVVQHALVERLLRAYETVALAERLKAIGGPAWAWFLELRACERATDFSPRAGGSLR